VDPQLGRSTIITVCECKRAEAAPMIHRASALGDKSHRKRDICLRCRKASRGLSMRLLGEAKVLSEGQVPKARQSVYYRTAHCPPLKRVRLESADARCSNSGTGDGGTDGAPQH